MPARPRHRRASGMSDLLGSASEGAAPGWPVVLYFHHVSPTIRHYTSLTPSAFRRGLELCLQHLGQALDPADIEQVMANRGCDAPSFLVTFDDGYVDVLKHALPILDDLGIRAVHFVIAAAVEHGTCEGIPTPRAPFLTAAQLDAFVRHGHRIGAHSRTHRRFDALTLDEVRREMCATAPGMAPKLKGQSGLFAYPYGILPHEIPAVPSRTLAFGTVKSAALPWDEAPHAIRRTFLPVGCDSDWPELISTWRFSWFPAFQ